MGNQVYPTSIVAENAVLESIRNSETIMSTFAIEGIHITVFVVVILFIFLGMYRSAKN
ncbi:MAG: hypothetical protein H6622_11265 [Halobacteriovoraceae bacterium]|nr:hypothetical protein [Halobacteriovoraceae bacterium]